MSSTHAGTQHWLKQINGSSRLMSQGICIFISFRTDALAIMRTANTANLHTTSLRSDGHSVCEHVSKVAGKPTERWCTSCPHWQRHRPPLLHNVPVTLHLPICHRRPMYRTVVHVPICHRRPAPAEIMPSGIIERYETHHLHSRDGTWLLDAEAPHCQDVAHRRSRTAFGLANAPLSPTG
jgi:hypothetical protein